MTSRRELQALSDRAGLAWAYEDAWGKHRSVSDATLEALLRAMENDAGPEAAVPPVIVVRDEETTTSVPLTWTAHTGGTLAWSLELENGAGRHGKISFAKVAAHGGIPLGVRIPMGYHRLSLRWRQGRRAQAAETTLIVAPCRCFRPDALEEQGRRWGISLQLYALRSARNWGIGDFTDLVAVLRGAGRMGAACVGLNPLHALFHEDPGAASPYSPNSRLFINTLYIDVEAIAEYAHHVVARRLVAEPAFQAELARLRAQPLIDYAAVAACKEKLLRVLYGTFRTNILSDPDHARTKSFRAFQKSQGDLLWRFATFVAKTDDPVEVGYREYLQWQADEQLNKAQDVARRLGLSIGLYQDIAVGINASGADASLHRAALIADVSVGAPPDLLNMKGQDWGLVPFDPKRLRAMSYAPIRELLGAMMRRGGALRIDHILGFLRLYLIPKGMTAVEGAYLAYPWKDLLAILTLESHRHRCLVIGEDLGTVPPGLREDLESAGVLTMRVFYFEKGSGAVFHSPASYPREAMVTVGTHDLPTLAGYWSGADIDLRTRLNLWPTPEHRARELAGRAADRRAIAAFAGVAEETAAPVVPVYVRLSQTPCRLLMVQIEDIIGQVEQMNVPGTLDQYPNWQVRLAQPIEMLFSNSVMVELANALAERSDLPRHLEARPATGKGPSVPEVPRATYRLQFSAAFTFDDAARIVPYLAALGISHLYASPWLKARKGSKHGYDVVDYTTINPEVGGAEGFEHLALVLKSYGIGHILDLVPNHMGVGDGSNGLWLSVLEHGRSAPAARFFDIAWRSGLAHLRDKILLPVLSEHYGAALERGAFRLCFDSAAGTFSIRYRGQFFPLSAEDYAVLLEAASLENADLIALGTAFNLASNAKGAGRVKRLRALQSDLAMLAHRNPPVAAALRDVAEHMSNQWKAPKTLSTLNDIIERQNFRLAHWTAAADEINYRRFFNINDLVAIRVERREMFHIAHRLVARLIAEGKIHGLRIDHVDGLIDPEAYCRDLRNFTGPPANGKAVFIVVEKILARHERLRTTWPVQGTTGYEFTAQLSGLLVDSSGAEAMSRIYHRFIGVALHFEEILAEAKAQILDTMFHSELRMLSRRIHQLARRHWKSSDYSRESLRLALRAVIMHFPVYRSYVGEDITVEDRRDIDWAVARAAKTWRAPGREVLDFVRDAITGDLTRKGSDYPKNSVIRFARQFQLLTSPVMAKSLEDTSFYRYHRLIALNEVGGDPRQFGSSLAAFHAQNRERARLWPSSLLATATHDTKRGEDARARLLALPEIASLWGEAVFGWAKLNVRHKTAVDGQLAPDANDEYLFYQATIGAWPLDAGERHNVGAFAERLSAFMIKAIREAKQKSSWDNPNAAYEAAVMHFVKRVLDAKFGRAFLRRLQPLARQLAYLGLLNSLRQTVLKICAPGVPDFYQGSELWDLSLVDPDNRRPVDFSLRCTQLAELRVHNDVPELLINWHDGRIKLGLIMKLLALRRALPDLFIAGTYEPLRVEGDDNEGICLFLRRHLDSVMIVAVRRNSAETPLRHNRLPLPRGRWHEVLTDQVYDLSDETGLSTEHAFSLLPVAVWTAENPT